MRRPPIVLSIPEIGSHHIMLRWNGSLRIRDIERVALSLDVYDDTYGGVMSRRIQLSLLNPWHNYNIMRLKPLNNYTFCLVYRLITEAETSMPDRSILLKSCVSSKTQESLSFWNSLSSSTVLMIIFLFISFILFLSLRTLYLHFYIWHEARLR